MSKITMRDLFARLDRSEQNSHSPDVENLLSASDIPHFDYWMFSDEVRSEFEQRLTCHHVIKWVCTDTWVGADAYFLDDEPLALSIQTARKNSKDFKFVSYDMVKKLRQFIADFQAKLGVEEDRIDLLDMDEVTDDDYSVHYGEQLLTDTAFYEGQPATVIEKYSYFDSDPRWNPRIPTVKSDTKMWTKVKVRLQDGTEKVIDLKDFRIPMALNV